MPKSLVASIAIVMAIIAAAYLFWPQPSIAPQTSEPSASRPPAAAANPTSPTATMAEPVAEFKSRITKKPFGIFVEPNNSPVQPERFTGYHTGVDVEYGDVKDETPVHAITAGQVIYAGTAHGYGGVVAIQHVINNDPIVGIYGHLDPASLPQAGTKVQAGDTIGRLGDGFSAETDGERKHLHLGLYKGSILNLRGYVQNQSELAAWLDPVTVF